MKVLVTGGAGYIGSVTAQHLLDRGHQVVVLDDMSTGHRDAVPEDAELIVARVQHEEALGHALDSGVDAVVHFASRSLVGESMDEPLLYFHENLGSALALLEGMHRAKVRRLVFSSSAAVYGIPDREVIDEEAPLAPVNPYGHTKVMVETMLREEARARGLSAIALRYFNACGADGPRGEDHRPETHLIPRLCLHLLGRLDDFEIHGGDYPTPDGTAVRDYVHVRDLARAHALALEDLDEPGYDAINLGTGRGASVREVLEAAGRIAGKKLQAPTGGRRPGDPPRLVASRDRAGQRLGWTPEESDLDRILRDAYEWHADRPEGYDG